MPTDTSSSASAPVAIHGATVISRSPAVLTAEVDGEIVMFERRIATIDEAALRDELADVMPTFRRDFANIAEANRLAVPYLLAANDRLKAHDVGMNRFVAS